MNILTANNFEFPDFILSNIFIPVIVLPILFTLLYLFVFKRWFSFLFSPTSVFNNIKYTLPFFIVLPAVLTVPILGICAEKYGYADNKPEIFAGSNSTVYALSSMNHNGRSHYTVYRLHFFDGATGNEYERCLLPRDLHKMSYQLIGHTLWIDNYSKKKVEGFNLSDGKKTILDNKFIARTDHKSGISGIASFQVDFTTNTIKVLRKDGSDTLLYPFNTINDADIRLHAGEISTIPDFPKEFQFALSGEKQKKLFLNDVNILNDKYFLDGEFLANLPEQACFVLFHYTNTDHKNITIESYSYTLQQKWILNIDELPSGEVNTFFQNGEKLFVVVDKSLVCINVVDGKVLWSNRM